MKCSNAEEGHGDEGFRYHFAGSKWGWFAKSGVSHVHVSSLQAPQIRANEARVSNAHNLVP
jgi:hypothetical protein